MQKSIIDYTKLTAPDLNDLCSQVITNLTGNSNFPNLPVTLANMTTINTALKTAMDATATKDRQKLAVVRQKKVLVCAALRNTSMYVNNVCNGDAAMLLTSGLTLSKVPEKRTIPEQVVNLQAVYTNNPGKISLKWDTAKFARTYNVWMSADNGATWSMMETTYSRKTLCDALVSGTRYKFKVVAANQYGEAPPSDVAAQLAA